MRGTWRVENSRWKETPMMREAEIGVKQLVPRHRMMRTARRENKGGIPLFPEGPCPCPHPDVRHPDCRAARERSPVVGRCGW